MQGMLPASFYEYRFDPVVKGFIGNYAERLAQIASYGQKTTPDSADLFDLAERQLLGLEKLTERGVLAKINSVLIPGINDEHLIALNREERGNGELSAIQEVERDFGIPVVSIVSLTQVLEFLADDPQLKQHLPAVEAYRAQYGI
jgi:hypothetical protein